MTGRDGEQASRMEVIGRRLTYSAVAVLTLADLGHVRHAAWPLEGWFGFYSLYGVAAVLLTAGVARLLGRFILRHPNRSPGDDDA